MGIQDHPVLSAACIAGVAFGLMLAAAAPAAASTITEFPLPAGTTPGVITAGPDGALWFRVVSPPGPGADKIGRITTTGSFSEFSPPTPGFLFGITTGPDGALWFTEWSYPGNIGRLTTGGSFSEFLIPRGPGRPGGPGPWGITAGPDGALWFTENTANKIGRVTTSGSFSDFPIPTAGSSPIGITAGPDGALLFAELGANKIGRVTTSGTFSEFPIPTAGSGAQQITAGPDGALWFTEPFANPGKVGRIATTGTITEFSDPTLIAPNYITAGSDGALWFTVVGANKIGRLTTGGSLTEFPIPTPAAGAGGITAGPDGALWFSEYLAQKIGTISPAAAEQPISNAQAVAFGGTEGPNSCGTVAPFSDADSAAVAADYSVTIDWGDVTPSTAGTITGDGNGNFTVSGCHTHAEEGKYTITVRITDVDNPSNNATVTSTATTVDAHLSGSCTALAASGTVFAGPTATFTDTTSTGTLTDFSATIDWGDGSSSAGAIAGGPGNAPYTVSGTHTYAVPGFYTITTTINDVGGSSLRVSCGSQTFVFPPSTPGCAIDGAGKITAANGDKAEYTVDAEVGSSSKNESDEDNKGAESVQTYRDFGPATAFRFQSTQTLAVTCKGNTSGSIYGTGTVDRTTSVFFIIDVTAGIRDESARGQKQNDEEGSPATYRIRLSNGYDSGQQNVYNGGIKVQIEQDEDNHHREQLS